MATAYPRALVRIDVLLFTEGAKLDGESAQDASVSIDAVPLDVEWESTEPEEADEATITLRLEDLPIDPRAWADATVHLFAMDVGAPDVTLRTTHSDALQFEGYADEPEVDLDDRQRVTIRARDYSGRLRQTTWLGGSIAIDRPLSQCIAEALGQLSFYASIAATLDIERDDSPRTYAGKKRWTPPRNASMWDVIQGLARLTGQTARFRLGTLAVAAPRERTGDDARQMLYGQNVARLTMRRSLNPARRKSIEIQAFDPRSGTRATGRYPPNTANSEEVVSFPLIGSYSPEQLKAKAKALYDRSARSELRGKLDTPVMFDRFDTPLWTLKHGDDLQIAIAGTDQNRVLGKSQGQIANLLEAKGVNRQVADAIAQAWVTGANLRNLFYVRRAKKRITQEGFSLSVEFEAPLPVED